MSFRYEQSLSKQTPEYISYDQLSNDQIEYEEMNLIRPSQEEILNETIDTQIENLHQQNYLNHYNLNISQWEYPTLNSVINDTCKITPINIGSTFSEYLTSLALSYKNMTCSNDIGNKFAELIKYGIIPIDYKLNDKIKGYIILLVPSEILLHMSNSVNSYDDLISFYINLYTNDTNLTEFDSYYNKQNILNIIDEIEHMTDTSIFNIQTYGYLSIFNESYKSSPQYALNTLIHIIQSLDNL